MLAAGFKSNPPVSKQTPFPTKVIFGPARPISDQSNAALALRRAQRHGSSGNFGQVIHPHNDAKIRLMLRRQFPNTSASSAVPYRRGGIDKRSGKDFGLDHRRNSISSAQSGLPIAVQVA